ncbi:MAG: hypothetical protein DRQ88_07700 [Epsilonproteobacteria bacterium]|nr:MAG: hypothetical protein DRQ89_04960 [Campylobacterota bacterium]RLA66139.1 MAG: hypothetical protein DRQ88_07700 [Campylobacterota bacterium]
MIASGIQTLIPVEIQTDNNSQEATEDIPNDFLNFLDEMQNRGMVKLQLTVLPDGKIEETVEEVKEMKFDLKEVPNKLVKKEEGNVLTFKNESLRELKGDKKIAKLESNDLFLSQRDISKTSGKNEGLNNFNKIYNIKKDNKVEAATEEANILTLMEGKKDLGEIGKSEAPKENKLQFGDTKQLFNWISKIVAKNSIHKGQALNLAIKDGTLGQFNIVAQSLGEQGQLNMKILTQSEAGKDFFNKHENLLMNSLEKAGLKVSEFTVQLAGSNNFLNNDMATLISDGQEAIAERFEENMFEREELDQDSRRRQRIWEEIMDKRSRGA